jgi:hypothetical protein
MAPYRAFVHAKVLLFALLLGLALQPSLLESCHNEPPRYRSMPAQPIESVQINQGRSSAARLVSFWATTEYVSMSPSQSKVRTICSHAASPRDACIACVDPVSMRLEDAATAHAYASSGTHASSGSRRKVARGGMLKLREGPRANTDSRRGSMCRLLAMSNVRGGAMDGSRRKRSLDQAISPAKYATSKRQADQEPIITPSWNETSSAENQADVALQKVLEDPAKSEHAGVGKSKQQRAGKSVQGTTTARVALGRRKSQGQSTMLEQASSTPSGQCQADRGTERTRKSRSNRTVTRDVNMPAGKVQEDVVLLEANEMKKKRPASKKTPAPDNEEQTSTQSDKKATATKRASKAKRVASKTMKSYVEPSNHASRARMQMAHVNQNVPQTSKRRSMRAASMADSRRGCADDHVETDAHVVNVTSSVTRLKISKNDDHVETDAQDVSAKRSIIQLKMSKKRRKKRSLTPANNRSSTDEYVQTHEQNTRVSRNTTQLQHASAATAVRGRRNGSAYVEDDLRNETRKCALCGSNEVTRGSIHDEKDQDARADSDAVSTSTKDTQLWMAFFCRCAHFSCVCVCVCVCQCTHCDMVYITVMACVYA